MSLLEALSENARNLYTNGIVRYADEHGVCKATQRELAKATGMSSKTLGPARDELVSKGIITRYKFAYQGKRDWYRLVELSEANRERKRTERERRLNSARDAAELTLELPLAR